MRPEAPLSDIIFASEEDFEGWYSLNDSIMGGQSNASCRATSNGLFLEGKLIEEGGGFVSCRSPILSPPLNLSAYKGLELNVDGGGKTLKIALACKDKWFGLTEIFQGGLRWIAPVHTNPLGMTKVSILFDSLEPSIRAKPVSLPLAFDSSSITQIQLLYSKFGHFGQSNPGFLPGPININLRSISAIS